MFKCQHQMASPSMCVQLSADSRSRQLWSVACRDTAVPAEGNGDLQTLICVPVARPRRCPTLSNPVPWQNWMAVYLGYTRWMKTLFRGWPVMVHDMRTKEEEVARNDLLIPRTRTANYGPLALPCPVRHAGIVCCHNWSLLHWHCSSSVTDSKLYCFLIAMRERCRHDFVIGSHGHKLIL